MILDQEILKLQGVQNALTRYLKDQGKTITKNSHDYIKYSKDFKIPENHTRVIAKSESFRLFVEQLASI